MLLLSTYITTKDKKMNITTGDMYTEHEKGCKGLELLKTEERRVLTLLDLEIRGCKNIVWWIYDGNEWVKTESWLNTKEDNV